MKGLFLQIKSGSTYLQNFQTKLWFKQLQGINKSGLTKMHMYKYISQRLVQKMAEVFLYVNNIIYLRFY